MPAKDEVLKIIYYAFLDIRQYAGQNKGCFALADVLHNVPLQIARAIDGEMSYEDILADITQRFRFSNCEPWLDNVLAHIRSRPPE